MMCALRSVTAQLESSSVRRTTPCGDGELVWREWRHATSDACLVLLHGGYGSWLHWVRNIEYLAERFNVLAVDLPGLGESSLPAEPFTPEHLGAIVTDGLSSLLNGRDCHLTGFSFGGLIAGQVAKTLGERVSTLNLVGASGLGLVRQPVPLIARTKEMSEAERSAAHAHNVRALMLFAEANVDELALQIHAFNNDRARLRSRRISMGSSLRDALPSVSAPVHGIWGAHDAVASPHLPLYEELLKRLKPGTTFSVLPGAGHWVQYEVADAFNRCLSDLLEAA